MTLNELGEFGLIRNIQKKWGGQATGKLLLGIGDDAAAIVSSPNKAVLLTTDTLMENVHFARGSSFLEIGYKAMAVNVSDIAAMGGQPLFYLVSLGLSGKESDDDIDQLYRGMNQAGREAKIRLIGGNITRSIGGFFVSMTLIGEVSQKEMVTRSGGAVGDLLYVTGRLGDAAASGYTIRPHAKWREGRLLAQKQIPSAMIDLSDGLSSDLAHLANQSGVGAEIWADQIPISLAVRRCAKKKGIDPLSYALHGGEDYELLFSVSEKKQKKLEQLIEAKQISAQWIGRLVEKKAGLRIKNKEGKRSELIPAGYDHLSTLGARRAAC